MSDIEEFLRRAAQRRAQGKRPSIEIVEPVEAEIIDAEPVDVAAHVTSYLDSSKFTQRASHMAERVGLADEVLEAHLHTKFDHQLGSLRRPDTTLDDLQPTPTPEGLLEALRSPESLRKAVVISEILRPPWERW